MIEPRPQVRGVGLDAQTRCAHYNSPIDIIAIKMKCCGSYYACKDCHDALAGHAVEVWPHREWDTPAVLCGACGLELTVRQYLACSNVCPGCGARFNPGCRHHYHFYFETI
ncbi:CHY zinc finger protein [Granulicella rosea]|uniref:CHY zinc finger protein n=1 Tax=Granulicella rosea TaxID=474952 RepID=UPI000B79382E|nr:CHY zinc finger protein [Granulicella rosea]